MTRVTRPGRPKKAPVERTAPLTVNRDAGWSSNRARNALKAAERLETAEPGKWAERIDYWQHQLAFAEKREAPNGRP